jgi:hypothetical protein
MTPPDDHAFRCHECHKEAPRVEPDAPAPIPAGWQERRDGWEGYRVFCPGCLAPKPKRSAYKPDKRKRKRR